MYRLAIIVGLCALSALGARPARADLLDPASFQSLGAFPTNPSNMGDTFTVNTDPNSHGAPILTADGTTIAGVYTTQGSTTIAVFTFDSVLINNDIVLNVTGSRPFALLSKGDITITASGSQFAILESNGQSINPGAGGGAGGNKLAAGAGPGGGGPGSSGLGGGGGGGFGGAGGTGTPAGMGGAGGLPYGDPTSLAHILRGGSGGGGTAAALGGGGGGALELGALGKISITGNGEISTEGGFGLEGSLTAGGGGGGSGGGILIHAPTVDVSGFINAVGGGAGPGPGGGAAGGGGGRVLVLSDGGTINASSFDVSGMNGGAAGSFATGPLTVPEPASLALIGLGLAACGVFSLRRRVA